MKTCFYIFLGTLLFQSFSSISVAQDKSSSEAQAKSSGLSLKQALDSTCKSFGIIAAGQTLTNVEQWRIGTALYPSPNTTGLTHLPDLKGVCQVILRIGPVWSSDRQSIKIPKHRGLEGHVWNRRDPMETTTHGLTISGVKIFTNEEEAKKGAGSQIPVLALVYNEAKEVYYAPVPISLKEELKEVLGGKDKIYYITAEHLQFVFNLSQQNLSPRIQKPLR